MFVPAPEGGDGGAAVLARDQQVPVGRGGPSGRLGLRNNVVGVNRGSAVPGVDGNGASRSGLVDAVIIGRAAIAALGAAGAVAVTSAGTGTLGGTAAGIGGGGVIVVGLVRGKVVRVGVGAMAFGRTGDVASLEVETAGITDHGAVGGTTPEGGTFGATVTIGVSLRQT